MKFVFVVSLLQVVYAYPSDSSPSMSPFIFELPQNGVDVHIPKSDDSTIYEIVGGKPVSPAFKFPWMVSIQSSGFHFCGGSLLNAETIITAAHCSMRSVSSYLRVIAHRHDLSVAAANESALVFEVTSINVHPNYNSENYRFDAAIWKVKLLTGDASTIPSGIIKLDDGSHSTDGLDLECIGWGTTSYGGPSSKILMEVTVPVVPVDKCQVAYPNVDPSSLCAGLQEGGKDSCQGDSGGPLFTVVDNIVHLVGIVSWGQGCAFAGYPGVYSRISYFADWITQFL